ncbi:hypothetical protein Rhe02_29290 [Rhizocola hellebori]|uniref:Uncharacterized protein n=1 Tax=Rhizocola hellebori TaxID=1392758 RepID=A0A8J3Q7L7_9ACTN|nr:DUF6084 family protein [Rhizocola hellebori]GIH04862.1 hypothetical protein Rhe02_29290 [Rhizocola hellebori]
MGELSFECVGARATPHAAVPTLTLRLRVTERTGVRVGAIALRCQIQILPAQRRYSAKEGQRLHDLFGDPSRWGETLKPLHLTTLTVMVPTFSDSIEIDIPIPCSYDLEVAGSRYFASLDDGLVPMLLLFSGTVFHQGPTGLLIEQVPWHCECAYRLPVAVWREIMDMYFPDAGWLRLRRDTLDALAAFKSSRALVTWNEAVQALLAERI